MSSSTTGSGQGVVSPEKSQEDRDNDVGTDNGTATDHEVSHLVHVYIKMLHVIKEVSLMLLFVAAYAALSQDGPRTSKSPPAFPFFPENSVVKDWYRGEVSDTIINVGDKDVSMIMFYAPWDAESQEIRHEYELAAQHMHHLVSFSAINCWQPGSECRNKYKKVYSWPVIIAYLSNRKVVQYNGPKKALHIVRFLNNIMYPIKRLETHELLSLRLHYDAAVVAKIDVQPRSWTFGVFYMSALKFLERDSSGDVAFVVLSKAQNEIPFLQLHLWNETLFYPDDEEFKQESIINWISKHLHQVTMWVVPTGTKSQQLAAYLQGPALIMFTPYNPLVESMDYYNMLKMIGTEYFSCDTANNTYEMMKKLRTAYREQQKLLLKQCSIQTVITSLKKYRPVTYSYSFSLNNTCFIDNEKCKIQEMCSYEPSVNAELNVAEQYKTSMLTDDNDLRSPKQLLKNWNRHLCMFKQVADNYHTQYFSRNIFLKPNISGLSCRTNNTLSFIALDSLLYYQFAERFGIDILNQKNKTAILIINEKEEVHHIFDGDLNDSMLLDFILNYTNNNLPRALHSISLSHNNNNRSENILVSDLNSHNFIGTIMSNKAIVVLYYSKQCAFCSGISHAFLTVAKFLSEVKQIQFARIDGDLNSLPWEYTMETYPAILFFPVKRKSESRAYPSELPMTVPNLLSFILINVKSPLKLHVMWTVCNQQNDEDERRSCISSLRIENLVVIEDTLKQWRLASPRSRQRILYQLQQLKSFHLMLAVEPNSISKRHYDEDVQGFFNNQNRFS